ncbi:hypothetical protein NQ315_002746 [Exocentrus adspersus]|uniref:Chitin-binding type-4 domain-containing protein n=1 Tax=Exocentrus adspersus TaxID=1586481 RepID=A0AAV8VJY7_9CUCU|nr:hypothetical protein NQ315_002746 [Exocentrus adspersus]
MRTNYIVMENPSPYINTVVLMVVNLYDMGILGVIIIMEIVSIYKPIPVERTFVGKQRKFKEVFIFCYYIAYPLTKILCVLTNPNSPEPGEECFQPLTLEDGSSTYTIQNQADNSQFQVINRVKLPSGLTCDRCVLRWNYRGANQWAQCDDGTFAMGCGDQETFRSCADIAIV